MQPITDPSQLQQAAERILASGTFARNQQLKKLLSYLCAAAAGGGRDRVTETEIGLDVFHRRDFDPNADTIVRVQMRRLRQKLEEYYSGEGSGETVRLTIGKNNYWPQMVPVETAPVLEAVPAAGPRRFRLSPFWRGFLAACLVCALLGGAFWAMRWQRAPRAEAPAARHPFWAPWTRSAGEPVVAIATPLFFRTQDGYTRDFRLNLPEDLPHTDRILGTPGVWPVWDTWVGMSDLLSASHIEEFLQSGGKRPRIVVARRLTQEDMRTRPLIVLGHPRGAPILLELLAGRDFQAVREAGGQPMSGFRNRNPRPGEQALYTPSFTSEVERATETVPDFALVSALPGGGGGHILSVFGNRYRTELLLSRKLTDPAFLDELARRLFGGPRPHWPPCQIVFSVNYINGEPIEASYVTHRLY